MEVSNRSQDELVDLFTRTLTFAATNPALPAQQFAFPSDRSKHPVYASTHYVQPSYSLPSDSTEAILLRHDIDPTHLFTCQLELFTSSTPDQRLRLLELWRTAPLRASDKDDVRSKYGDLTQTNLLQEEVMARLRYERNLAEQKAAFASKPIEDAEPYMVTGYAETTKSQGQLWGGTGQGGMEDQYGAFMAARDFERFQELQREVVGRPMGEDEMMA